MMLVRTTNGGYATVTEIKPATVGVLENGRLVEVAQAVNLKEEFPVGTRVCGPVSMSGTVIGYEENALLIKADSQRVYAYHPKDIRLEEPKVVVKPYWETVITPGVYVIDNNNAFTVEVRNSPAMPSLYRIIAPASIFWMRKDTTLGELKARLSCQNIIRTKIGVN